jgi:hypothetical protein
VEERTGYAEYVCEDCGHPFCFATGEAVAGGGGSGRITAAGAGPPQQSTTIPGTASAASSG